MWWYAAQVAREEPGSFGMQVWTLAVGVWILTVGLLLALLWRRLKGVLGGAS